MHRDSIGSVREDATNAERGTRESVEQIDQEPEARGADALRQRGAVWVVHARPEKVRAEIDASKNKKPPMSGALLPYALTAYSFV